MGAEGEAEASVQRMGPPLELTPFDALPAEHGEVCCEACILSAYGFDPSLDSSTCR